MNALINNDQLYYTKENKKRFKVESIGEIIAISLVFFMAGSTVTIGIWSAVLFLAGNTTGANPVGLLFNLIHTL